MIKPAPRRIDDTGNMGRSLRVMGSGGARTRMGGRAAVAALFYVTAGLKHTRFICNRTHLES